MRRAWNLLRSIFRDNDDLWILLMLLWAGRYGYFFAWVAVFCLLVQLVSIVVMRRLHAKSKELRMGKS